jgi:hypothetical protein
MMTSVIGALFVGTAGWLGWQAWKVGDLESVVGDRLDCLMVDHPPPADFGHLSERLCVMAGL